MRIALRGKMAENLPMRLARLFDVIRYTKRSYREVVNSIMGEIRCWWNKLKARSIYLGAVLSFTRFIESSIKTSFYTKDWSHLRLASDQNNTLHHWRTFLRRWYPTRGQLKADITIKNYHKPSLNNREAKTRIIVRKIRNIFLQKRLFPSKVVITGINGLLL